MIGLAGFSGAVGGMLVAPVVGYWLDFSHGFYGAIFAGASLAYLSALIVIHLLVPNVQPIDESALRT